jgi:hypothetical protein
MAAKRPRAAFRYGIPATSERAAEAEGSAKEDLGRPALGGGPSRPMPFWR